MDEFEVQHLLKTALVTVRDVYCRGSCSGRTSVEYAAVTQLVFPYRGVYVRHLGRDDAVAEANQVLFFNASDGYQVSHPVPGGDASLTIGIAEELLRELAPPAMLRCCNEFAFAPHRLQIDPGSQALAALLRHRLRSGIADPLEAESSAVTLVQRALGADRPHDVRGNGSAQRLVDRAKAVVTSDLSRRWTLSDVAAELGCSPVYATQAFAKTEGIPLYRYHLRLRLARALDLISEYDDLTRLSLDLGFSSHSHFSAAFREAYGRPPSEFRHLALHR
jgi:AraC family transcriptional regulator